MGLEGNVGVAAYGVIANLSLVIIAVYTGIAQGIQPLISSSYGAGRREEMLVFLRYALAVMAVFSVVIYACVFLWLRPLRRYSTVRITPGCRRLPGRDCGCILPPAPLPGSM